MSATCSNILHRFAELLDGQLFLRGSGFCSVPCNFIVLSLPKSFQKSDVVKVLSFVLHLMLQRHRMPDKLRESLLIRPNKPLYFDSMRSVRTHSAVFVRTGKSSHAVLLSRSALASRKAVVHFSLKRANHATPRGVDCCSSSPPRPCS